VALCRHAGAACRCPFLGAKRIGAHVFSPAQADGTALILANDVERVLADIDADYGGEVSSFLSHGMLSLSSVTPASIRWQGGSTAGSFL